MSTSPFWVSAFLDFAPDAFEPGVAFWQGVTGYALSERRGVDGAFATLVPPDGDDYLRVQRLEDGDGRVHLDLHVENPTIAAEAAIELGAHVLMRHEQGYVVLRSPGGFVFCFVRHHASRRPAPATFLLERRESFMRMRLSVACLTLFDMLKAIDREMRIGDIAVSAKSGGRSGDWRRAG